MNVSRAATYAIAAVMQLAKSNAHIPISSVRLAEAGGMPERFLLQILRMLTTHEVLHSTRGVVGGYTLHRPLDKISLLDIIEAVDGPISGRMPSGIYLPIECCARLRRVVDDISSRTRSELQIVTLADLALAPHSNRSLC